MKIQAFILDLAGTTIRDGGTVLRAFEGAIRDEKISYRPEFLLETMGQSKTKVLAEVARQAGVNGAAVGAFVERTHARFQRLYAAMCAAGEVAPIAGVPEALAELKRRGLRLAATTGFHAAAARAALDALDPRRAIFDTMVSSDEVAEGRPAPDLILAAAARMGIRDLKSVANVGDTPSDLRSADRAGVALNVGVLTGETGREALLACPHTHLLDSAADLPTLLDLIEAQR
jgi:phosphonatase-like hydrolase